MCLYRKEVATRATLTPRSDCMVVIPIQMPNFRSSPFADKWEAGPTRELGTASAPLSDSDLIEETFMVPCVEDRPCRPCKSDDTQKTLPRLASCSQRPFLKLAVLKLSRQRQARHLRRNTSTNLLVASMLCWLCLRNEGSDAYRSRVK